MFPFISTQPADQHAQPNFYFWRLYIAEQNAQKISYLPTVITFISTPTKRTKMHCRILIYDDTVADQIAQQISYLQQSPSFRLSIGGQKCTPEFSFLTTL